MNRKQQRLTLIFALLVGLVFFLRNILLIYGDWKNPNLVFTPFSGGDEDIYAAQIREVFEGKLFSGDAYSWETSSRFPIYAWLTPLLLGLMAKVFNSVGLVLLVGDFIFPLIIFLFIVKFVFHLTKTYWPAVITSLSALFLFQLINKIPPITKNLAQGFWQTLTLNPPLFLYFNRLPTQFTFIIFLLFIISLYCLLSDRNKSKLFALVPGIISGLLAYIYFFQWSASVAVLGTCLGLNLLIKNKPVIKKLLIALASAVIISSGYLYQIFSHNLIDKQIQEGRIDSRFIEPLTTLRYGLFALMLFWLIKKQPLKQLLTGIFLAAVILINLQLVIGFTMSPGHWPNSTFEPMLVISSGILLIEIIKQIRWQKIFAWAWWLVFPIFLYGILNQIKVVQVWGNLYYFSPAEKKIYAWLNQNSRPDSVTLSFNRLINRRLPAITNNYPYLPFGAFSQISTQAIWERFNLANSIVSFMPEWVEFLLIDSNELAGYLFEQTYRYSSLSDLTGLVFPEEIKKIINQTHPFFNLGYMYIPDNIKQANLQKIADGKRIPLAERICRYRLDYLVLRDSEQQAMTQPLDENIFQLIFQQDDISLYQVKPGLCSEKI